MKQTLFILFSLIASLGQAITVKEATSVTNELTDGGIFPQSAAAVYALESKSPTVQSSVIDLGSVPGFYVTITGTATQVDVWWSVTPTAATFRREYSFNGTGTKWLSKQGRYAKFQVSPANLTYTTATVFYVLGDTLPVTATIAGGGAAQFVSFTAASGSIGSAGNVSLNAGTSSIGSITSAGNVSLNAGTASIGSITSAGNVSLNAGTSSIGSITSAGNVSLNAGTSTIGAVGVTSTVMPSWTVVSTASYSLTGTVNIDLATVAGSGRVFMYKISALGPGAGFYYDLAPSSTWVQPASYYAVSTTPVVEDYITTGSFLQLSATASAVTVTVKAMIYKLTQVVP